MVRLFVDKNYISRSDLTNIVNTINKIKTDGIFPNVNFTIDYKKIRNRRSNFIIVAQNYNKLSIDGDITAGLPAPPKAIA